MEPLTGHEAGNGGHSQGASCTPPRRSPTQLVADGLGGARREHDDGRPRRVASQRMWAIS
jgi:hypothetical protein